MGTTFRPECQAKQYVAVVQGQFSRFRVLTTGSDRHYLFCPLDVAMDPFPVLKADLNPVVRKMLARGCGNASE